MPELQPPVADDEPDTLSLPAWVESSRASLSGSAARDAIRARLFPGVANESSTEPRRVARFTILETLGRGGMGVVYAAYDPRLDRKVALKLVRSKLAARGPELLTHEAQGLAKLSHPNVVQVHEVGEHDDALFIAMEFVAGVTLRRWLEDRRGWQTILEILIAAGRGLEAAHAAGLVHRDFKPDNVLVGDDGRPRVLDFGLAQGIDLTVSSEHLPSTIDADDSHGARTLEPRRLAGTPAYMAPELFVGHPAGPAADQWAFCVVAYEALLGLRPFVGATLSELATAVTEDPPLVIGRRVDLPIAVREVILRGLAKRPEQRWASMTELLAALEQASARRSRLTRVTATLLVGGLAVLGAVVDRGSEDGPELCPRDPTALEGSWDAEREAALARHYKASQLPYASAALSVISERLDGWARDWHALRHETCKATHVHGLQSSELLDARVACLDRQRAEVDGLLTSMLEQPATTVVAESPALVDAIPDVADCQGRIDAAALPDDPERVAAIQAEYERLERANALRILGELDDAGHQLARLSESPTVSGHAPLWLAVQVARADLAFERRELTTSVDLLHAAALEARSLGLHDLEAYALVRAALIVADSGDLGLGPWILSDAERSLTARGRVDDPLAVQLTWAQGRLAERQGDLAAAERSYARALERAKANDELFDAERLWLDLGNVAAARGDLDRAERVYLDALEHQHERWGAQTNAAARIEENLGGLALARGDLDQAHARYESAAAIFASNDPKGRALASIADGRSKLAFMRGDLERARALIEEGLAIFESNGDLATERACNLALALGVVRYFSGDIEGSIPAYERALALIREVHGDRHALVGLAHSNIGDSLLALGQVDRARAEYVAALAVLETANDPREARLALPLAGLGHCDLEQGQPVLAVHRLERALTLVDPAEPQELARVQFGLARALAASGAEPERARELARSAAETFDRLGLTDQQRAVEAWQQ